MSKSNAGAFPPLDLDQILACMRALSSDLQGTRILVTGGTGFFGRWMIESLLSANAQLGMDMRATILSRNPRDFLSCMPHLSAAAALDWVAGSVATVTAKDFGDRRFDMVVHLATEADSDATIRNPASAFDVIAGGTGRALEVAVRLGARRVLFASSGSIYGRQPSEVDFIDENFSGRPDLAKTSDAYAISGEAKRQAELLCDSYSRDYGLGIVIARGFTFAGPGMPLDGKFAFGNFMRDALARREIIVSGDGTPIRSYLHAVDLTIWLWTMLIKGAPGRAYNVGSELPVTLFELANEIANVFNLSNVTVMRSPVPGQAPHRYVPSTARARVELGLRQSIGLRETIERSAAYWSKGVKR